jgi:hypothetical protein
VSRAPAILALAGALMGALAGCASTPPEHPAPSPASQGQAPGIELSWWIVDQSGVDAPSLDAALQPYETRAVPVPWKTVETWHANGLRLIGVPVGDLDDLRRSLRLAGPLQTQWLGQATRWTEAAGGPQISRPFVVGLDSGPLTLQNGRLRLMLRSWAVPGRTPDQGPEFIPGALQLEMVPQFVPSARPRGLSLPGQTPPPDAQPVPFPRLALETTLLTEEALLIVPEGLQVDPAGDTSRIGPQDTPLPTLGEALLLSSDRARNRASRVVIVLTPTVPREYRLAPMVR